MAPHGSPVRTGRGRAVLLVANPAAPYSRALRVGRSLAAAGWQVEIAATTGDRQPLDEQADGVLIRRYAPSGPFRRFAQDTTGRPAHAVGRVRKLIDLGLKAAAWPVHVRGWWRTLRLDLPRADLYHAFGILTIPIALSLARRDARQGPRPVVVYDVIDVVLESNNVDRVPPPLLATYRWRERAWVRGADAIVTVNDAIADHLCKIWRLPLRPTVLLNCQEASVPSADRQDLLRQTTGIPSERRVVLYLGRFGRERGLDEAAEAVLRLPDAALVLLGFGPWAEQLRARDRDPRLAGRHFTLPPVHPDAVVAWTASADATVVAVPANSLNQRLSTPNKFWESLSAGTPMVIGRDLTVMRTIVEAEAIGSVADPLDPDDLSRALAAILDLPPDEYEAMRQRAVALARSRYNWGIAVQPYLALIGQLTGRR